MADRFLLAFKSTIDKTLSDLSASRGLGDPIDLDASSGVAQRLSDPEPAIIWRFATLDEDPCDPLYSFGFVVGIKVTADPSTYKALDFVSDIRAIFKVGDSIVLYDWSGDATPTVKEGYAYFTSIGLDPQVTDQETGIRMLAVQGAANRFIAAT